MIILYGKKVQRLENEVSTFDYGQEIRSFDVMNCLFIYILQYILNVIQQPMKNKIGYMVRVSVNEIT